MLALTRSGLCLAFVMDIDERLKSDLERITGQRGIEAHETMTDVLARLDVVSQSPRTAERLKHYLKQRSYVKALAWLNDPSTPHHP